MQCMGLDGLFSKQRSIHVFGSSLTNRGHVLWQICVLGMALKALRVFPTILELIFKHNLTVNTIFFYRCTDSAKVGAHRRHHVKADSLEQSGFGRFKGKDDCGRETCKYR